MVLLLFFIFFEDFTSFHCRGHILLFVHVCDTLIYYHFDVAGLTESCAGCFTAIGDVFSMTGTVGVPLTTIEARLESVPEMGYDALSSEPRGEICLKGITLFSGYHKRQDLTQEVMVDGWFHTGKSPCCCGFKQWYVNQQEFCFFWTSLELSTRILVL